MNTYTSEVVDFFVLVLTSGLIAVTALAIASLIGFALAFVLFRERAMAAAPAGARAAAPSPVAEPRGMLPAMRPATEHAPAVAG